MLRKQIKWCGNWTQGAYIPQHDGPGDILRAGRGGEGAFVSGVAFLELGQVDGIEHEFGGRSALQLLQVVLELIIPQHTT